jgi:hypothetical protein
MEKTRATITKLLDYCAMQDKAVLAYKARKMILAVLSDAGYCNKKKSRSQAGGHYSYQQQLISSQQWCNPYPRNNN